MPIDFTQIESGEDFELLCEDLLRAMGFAIEAKVARGPDLGKDIITTQTVTDRAGFSETHRYLIECKHHAKGGKSVREEDIGSPIARMGTHNCDRYILVTSTVPSEKVRAQLAGIPNTVPHYRATVWHEGDLTRLLDQYPDVRERFLPSKPEPLTPAGTLAETVEGLLTAMGFVCQERQTAADRVRLVCTGKGAFARPMAVICKEGTVERGHVEALLAEVQAQGLGGGVLVTHARVSPVARERAVETDDLVRTFTLDEFYRELIDFEPYVRALVADYEGDELSTYYVNLGCQSGDGSVYKPMDGYVDRWLDDPTRNHISILGDYGTGKTSFCRQYAARLGRRWLSDPDHCRIPILISLRDYAKAVNLKQLVTDFLVNRYSIQAGYEAFRRFNADGKLVLLFDGFDEMAQKVDYPTTVDNFEELARAVEARSKVLLTCRTPYFRTRAEAEKLLSWRGPEAPIEARDLPERAVIDLTERPNFEIVHLLPFQPEDIQMMLRARFPAEWQGYWQQIEDTYNLKELAQRPVLLDMIARSLPHLKPGQALNAARLYEAYTDLWLLRDEEKGRRLITRADKRLFMQELALEMLRREEWSIHFSRLPERVRAHFRLEKAHEIDYFEHDIRTCSFLNRDGEGNYCFVHKSFGEFFVAQWLAPKLLDCSAPEMRINEEVRGFVHGLLAEGKWPPPPPPGVVVPGGMVWVPPGPFIYGESEGTRVVRLEHGYCIARTPVTNAQYARFVAVRGHEPPQHWRGKVPLDELCDHPVVNVSWDDAVAYAVWAGGRLPSEQEWEKAARGIDGRVYPWGDEFDAARCNSSEAGIGTTTPVGRYSSYGDSPCGCTDMAGNVWEWTASKYKSGSGDRVVRGGAFDEYRRLARCAYRDRHFPIGVWFSDGFRVVASSVSPASAL
ncbi:MAG TPA: SUMF1/EgtB/PvdO family nonheme iron enzyme [Anaerolineae bacterium]|nr:SUMF1/EgtB/PvdO family nonheme iron enzyme [Anaerolineae bacterium]